ncbi:hypothetical protein BBK82_39755 [Lentzea guizhouensis]|uniref:Uncharacterized protein n=1 Tax=Lentzea guizhouensis TaxID=1586287 RepID=A0A1B2HTY7_9PSEU|nr:hypothetical protein [Lentzea guizhouensis]ANZ41200.1 hypothetical protein BBK82_39755 [Lentzea guizhouensis]
MGRTVRTRAVKPVARAVPAPRSQGRVWAAFVTAFLLGLAVAFLVGSWTGPDATQQRIAELEREEADRDAAQLGPLTDQARQTRDRLAPVLAAMAQAEATPTAEVVSGWRDVVAEVARTYEQSPSAGNGINVARSGMRTAVQQLAAAVKTFELAAGQQEPGRGVLVALAREQRTLAVRTWSVAAVQLDVINIEAGRGHVHVQLSTDGDTGGLAVDGAPEGSGR